MFAAEYDAFVDRTVLNQAKAPEKREDIAIYGLVGEMGALTSAVKRRLIAESDGQAWNAPTDEVVEELGDSLWYLAALTRLHDSDSDALLRRDIENLGLHLARGDQKARLFAEAIGSARLASFQNEAPQFLGGERVELNAYQKLAFLTRRTEGQTLVAVCLTVLSQLGAELLRKNFPMVEEEINTVIENRDVHTILGEVAWHLSAIATVYGLSLAEVAKYNQIKIDRRLNRSIPTPSHDRGYPPHEIFPRQFQVSFIMVGNGRSRMYLDGRQFGDELTDNSHEDDGYRFHDVMHLAGVANLGWSPVLRSLLGIKRKSNRKTDEIEDGARAKIVEEAVIKAIHSEGDRVSAPRRAVAGGKTVQSFNSKNEITFQFLGFLSSLTKGLEVERNQYWEWESAILQGNEVFWKLRMEEQGTVSVDLDDRKITFEPRVYIDGPGAVVGMGTAVVDSSLFSASKRNERKDIEWAGEKASLIELGANEAEIAWKIVAKKAVLNALDLPLNEHNYQSLDVQRFERGVSVKATGEVRETMWKRKVISFRITCGEHRSVVTGTALAISDAM